MFHLLDKYQATCVFVQQTDCARPEFSLPTKSIFLRKIASEYLSFSKESYRKVKIFRIPVVSSSLTRLSLDPSSFVVRQDREKCKNNVVSEACVAE